MRRNQFAMYAVIIAACVVMAIINHAASKTTDQTPSPPAKPAATAAGATHPIVTSNDSQPLVTEASVGDPSTAKFRVTLGYTADTYVASHTDETNLIINLVKHWASSTNGASLRVVCVDIPTNLRSNQSFANIPIGLSMNGTPMPGATMNLEPDGLSVLTIMQSLSRISPPSTG